MYEIAKNLLTKAWYKSIWLDHYVLENDELNLALNSKKLARNFQWYCTKETTGQVYAFGVSAISQLESGYFQNTKDLEKYINNLQKKWVNNKSLTNF
jgi:oxygen-independent coproporphyrinogen-3 oxidase